MQTHTIQLPYLANLGDLDTPTGDLTGRAGDEVITIRCHIDTRRALAAKIRHSGGADLTVELPGTIAREGIGPRRLRIYGRI